VEPEPEETEEPLDDVPEPTATAAPTATATAEVDDSP
jgi:hypothetical protein